jgi:hypothetical protein
MGPRNDLDAVEKRKILLCRESNPGSTAHSPPLYRLSYPGSITLIMISLMGNSNTEQVGIAVILPLPELEL